MLIIKAALECKMIILENLFDVEQHVVGEKKNTAPILIGLAVI